MRLFLALILFFYTAFDACLAEAIAHQAANTVTIEANADVNAEIKNCHQSESEHGDDSQHSEVCHTCHSCHNWFGDTNDYSQLITLTETKSSYLFVLPRPDIQKIERPPIQN